MRHRRVHGLLLLNAVLLAMLAAVTFLPHARAQGVRRTTYVATGGSINGTPIGVLYVVDEGNQELVALQWQEQSGQIKGLGYRNLAADLRAGGGGVSR